MNDILMTKKLLITKKNNKLILALTDKNILYDIYIENPKNKNKKYNIYKGLITRIETSLESIFLEYYINKIGFISFENIDKNYFYEHETRLSNDIILGQELIVQIEKEENGKKGSSLTTNIVIPGCYLILMPNNPEVTGISKNIERNERLELNEILKNLDVPEGMGVIMRTSCIGKNYKEINWDLKILIFLWDLILKESKNKKNDFLLYEESNFIIRNLRDHLKNDIKEILVDDIDVYNQVYKYLYNFMPNFVKKTFFHFHSLSLFEFFKLQDQIEYSFNNIISLKSGGSVIINITEALISIDINSYKSGQENNPEFTSFKTNYEAIDEIAKQLRLRDLNGLIIIDFIDMEEKKNRVIIDQYFKKTLALDKAKIKIGNISRFCLLELSRQKLRIYPNHEMNPMICRSCLGKGHVISFGNLIVGLFKSIRKNVIINKSSILIIEVSIELSYFMFLKQDKVIKYFEDRFNIFIILYSKINVDFNKYNYKILDNEKSKTSYLYKSIIDKTILCKA